MKVTKNIIPTEDVERFAHDYFLYAAKLDFKALERIIPLFEKLKKNQIVVTFIDGVFVKAKITSMKNSWQSEDGPVVRVSNGEFSWRVDGNGYAYPWKE